MEVIQVSQVERDAWELMGHRWCNAAFVLIANWMLMGGILGVVMLGSSHDSWVNENSRPLSILHAISTLPGGLICFGAAYYCYRKTTAIGK